MEVTFVTEGGRVTLGCDPGENLLTLAKKAGVMLDAPCGGNGTCGKCRVKLLDGRLEAGISPGLTQEEQADGWRLACESKVWESCSVWVPIRQIGAADVTEQVTSALKKCSGDTLAEGLCCAIDIGTTTVSAVLLEQGKCLSAATVGNGQIPYGADVIHRIIAQSRPGGVKALQKAIVEDTLIPLLRKLCRDAGKDMAKVCRVAIGANTTMNHLLLGVSADSIRKEPYVPVFYSRPGLTAGELGLPVAPDAPVILAPNVGAFVGGDITAGTMDTGLHHRAEWTLFIDLGTNGEIVLGNRELMLCCACSAGPAFEGGDISCGMRATEGAAESVTIDEKTLRPQLGIIGGGKCAGICASGMIDLVAQLYRVGLIDPRGRFTAPGQDRYLLAEAQDSLTGQPIFVTEADIAALIRAKAAIYGAVQTLLRTVDMQEADIEKVLIAGGIGSGIRPENAEKIGMLPLGGARKTVYLGNTCLAGAVAMAVSDDGVRRCRQVAENMTYVELSTEPGYMEDFVAACFLPT